MAVPDDIADAAKSLHHSLVHRKRLFLGPFLTGLAVAVGGCDPGIHLAWEKDFEAAVDLDCVGRALKTVAPDVRRTSYVDDGTGGRGFGSGTTVTQFNYRDPTFSGGYSLDIAQLPSGKTHYWHGWSKIGTSVPDEEKTKVLPLLNRANAAAARRCGLSFAGSGPRVGDG